MGKQNTSEKTIQETLMAYGSEVSPLVLKIQNTHKKKKHASKGKVSLDKELVGILREVSWSVWEKLGYNNIQFVAVTIESRYFGNNLIDHVRVAIHTDDRVYDLYGFENLGLPQLELARYWKPYHDFLRRHLSEMLRSMEQMDTAYVETSDVKDDELEQRISDSLFDENEEEHFALMEYIDELDLMPVLRDACRAKNAFRIEDIRSTVPETAVAAVWYLLKEKAAVSNIVPEGKRKKAVRRLKQLQKYGVDAAKDSGGEKEAILRYLLKSCDRLEELYEKAKAADAYIRSELSPAFLNLYKRFGVATIMKKKVLNLSWKYSDEAPENNYWFGYAMGVIMGRMEVVWDLSIRKPELLPISVNDPWLLERIQKGTPVYEEWLKKEWESLTVITESGVSVTWAEVAEFGERAYGNTEEAAVSRLKDKYKKEKDSWVTEYVINQFFAD